MENTAPKLFVFVLMPFEETFGDVYKLGIKPACKDAGAYCERLDEQIFHENMLDRIYNQIAKADLIIADMSKRNPNVFYEAGYAHALGKRVILMTQDADDIPFDLKHYPHIVYDNRKIAELKPDLERRVRWFVEHPTVPADKALRSFAFRLNGTLIEGGAKAKPYERNLFELTIHNPSNHTYKQGSYKVAILGPRTIYAKISGDEAEKDILNIDTGNSRIMYLPVNADFFPDDWFRVVFTIGRFFSNLPEKEIPCEIVVYSELGKSIHPFTIMLD